MRHERFFEIDQTGQRYAEITLAKVSTVNNATVRNGRIDADDAAYPLTHLPGKMERRFWVVIGGRSTGERMHQYEHILQEVARDGQFLLNFAATPSLDDRTIINGTEFGNEQ